MSLGKLSLGFKMGSRFEIGQIKMHIKLRLLEYKNENVLDLYLPSKSSKRISKSNKTFVFVSFEITTLSARKLITSQQST